MADDTEYGFYTVNPKYGQAMFVVVPPPDSDEDKGWCLEWACPKCGLGHAETGHKFEVGSSYEIECGNKDCGFKMTGEIVILDM